MTTLKNVMHGGTNTNIALFIFFQREFVDAFPSILTGKVNRHELKQKEWNQFNK